jgi:beta-glucosidase
MLMITTFALYRLHGADGNGYVGFVSGNSRLNIPALKLSDGPQGFRDDQNVGTTTSFPAGISVAATWDSILCEKWGVAMGEEFYGKGANVQLGPGLNLARVPLNGRNFEYMSGGDPFLGYTLVQPVVRGIQSTGVIANAKHWVENNQETNRDKVII